VIVRVSLPMNAFYRTGDRLQKAVRSNGL